ARQGDRALALAVLPHQAKAVGRSSRRRRPRVLDGHQVEVVVALLLGHAASWADPGDAPLAGRLAAPARRRTPDSAGALAVEARITDEALQTGAMIGRYEILSKIAAGGMATVYLGRAHAAAGFERLVALKVCHAHL